MDSARGIHNLHFIAMFTYISHDEEKTSNFSWLPKLVFLLSQQLCEIGVQSTAE